MSSHTVVAGAPVAEGAATGPRTRRGSQGDPSYWWYLVPMGVGFVAIVAVPFVVNVWVSLHEWKGGSAPMTWVGFANYAELMGDDLFWSSFRNTIATILAIAVVPTLIGLLLAAVLFDYIGRTFGAQTASFLRATYYLPQILPIAVAGVLWSWILETRAGAFNSILSGLGVQNPPDWLGDPSIALYAVMIMLIWLQIGYPVVIFMSALQRVDPELYEAASLDGATWAQRFRHITVPSIRVDIYVVVLTATIGAMKLFAPILILTKGGPQSSTYVPSYFSYRNFFELSRVGYGSASATVLALIICVVAGGLIAWQTKHMEDR